ncbi:MAG: hypothetical protein KDD58_03380 [Bdellovibrionales bacterium]|nr:hypothetical protein [Bdellovibrionales bacterium]
MKYFILVTLLYFSYTVVFAMEDRCVSECTQECHDQAIAAEKALSSHAYVCKGEGATQNQPICATSCSKGCKAVMRGQRALVVDFYENCGGGDGSMGRLRCEKTAFKRYRVVNTHSLKYIGDSHALESQCEESIETLDYNIFCAKTSGGYAVYNLMGQALGVSSSFIHSCVESIMSVKNERLCIKESRNSFAIYDLSTMSKVSKNYKFFSSCVADL